MSGVYIPGMEMPTDCFDCQFALDGMCVAMTPVSTRRWTSEETTNYCPLIPVPDHGDLIDRTALYANAAEWEMQARHLAVTSPDARTFDKWQTILSERASFKFDVADAPTIIPADKEDT